MKDGELNLSYRMFIRPLTEKTGAKPERHEVMVNTETGLISVMNSDGKNVSALKDITSDIVLKKEIIKFTEGLNNIVLEQINTIEPKYKKEDTRTIAIENKINELKGLNKDITETIKLIRKHDTVTYVMLQRTVKLIYQVTKIFSDTYLDISKVEREIDHLVYLRGILLKNKTRMEKDISDIKKRNSNVEKMLSTKEYKTTYDAWVTDYVKRTKALINESKVSSISFTHKI